MAENLKLQKTVKIEDTEYDINAVRSDTAEIADKTQSKLIINESGSKKAEFDGSTEKTINYVNAAEGGKFSGPVLIDNKYTAVSEEVIPKDAIVNFGQINTRVRELTGAPLYTWNNDSQFKQLVASTGEFHRLNAIAGTLENFETFKRLLGIPNSTATTKPQAYYGVKLSARRINSVDCAVVAGYEDCGYPNVIVPYVGYIDYPNGKEDYNSIDRTIARPVVSIIDKAFDVSSATTDAAKESLKKIESVVIPTSVTAIGQYAFRGCIGLKSIVIPSSITSIGSSAFSGCTSLETVYYNGTDEDWADITIGSSNDYLKNATREPYNNSPETINFKEIIEKPFIYICTDALDSAVSHPNTIFLKLPGNFSFIELSKGATRLDSTSNTVGSQSYYTYDTLATIIAGINSRLAALGSTNLKLPSELTLSDTSHTLIPDTLVADEEVLKDKEVIVDETIVPSVLDLSDDIIKKTTYDNPDPVLRAVGGISVGDSLVKEDGSYYSVKEILTKMLYPYTEPIITWTLIEPANVVCEKGTQVTLVDIEVEVVKKTNKLESIALYKKIGNGTESIISSDMSGFSESGGQVAFSCNDTIDGTADTYTYYVKVTDDQGNTTTSAGKTFTFVYPYYYGNIDADTTVTADNFNRLSLQKRVITKQDFSQTYTTNNQKPVVAYPKAYGELKSITDAALPYSWTRSIITIKDVEYDVYTGDVSTMTNTYNFKY